MLNFFRKYQRIFFILVTTLVIISFSFFGTYATTGAQAPEDKIVFTALNGKQVSRDELEKMFHFLATDNEDKVKFDGIWGPNFLNDGVLKKDFLETGLAEMLASTHYPLIEPDLIPRIEKEKRFIPYSHPQAKFLSTETAWSYFAPTIKADFDALKSSTDKTSAESFNRRIRLYLSEQKFPQSALKQVLRYQEKQYKWVQPDPQLAARDLSLFGYHTAEDWFGQRFLHLVAEFIIDCSILAQEKGYLVSKEEALAELHKNAEMSFRQIQKLSPLTAGNSQEYMQEQLRIMGLDISSAVKIWQQVLMFRRLFHDVGHSALVDSFSYVQFNEYAGEAVELDLFQMPPDITLRDYRSFQNFETYLSAVAPSGSIATIDLPQDFLSVEEVKKNYPELVQKRYLISVSEVQKNSVKLKAGVKETWAWETRDENWPKLCQQFPQLASANALNKEERFKALDQMEANARGLVDNFAQDELLKSHPEWLVEAFEQATPRILTIEVRERGGLAPLPGISHRKEFMKMLDLAALPQKHGPTEEELLANQKLQNFTDDDQIFYRITVLDRSEKEEILTFAEANQNKILDQLANSLLEQHYLKMRYQHKELFQNADSSWKPFLEVKDLVANFYFSSVMKLLYDHSLQTAERTTDLPDSPNGPFCAKMRFHRHLQSAMAAIQKGHEEMVRTSSVPQPSNERLTARLPLNMQWKVVKTSYTARRNQHDQIGDSALFKMADGEWSKVYAEGADKSPFFFHVLSRAPGKLLGTSKIDQGHYLLSCAAQRQLMTTVLATIKQRQPLTLDWMNLTNQDEKKGN